MTACRSSLAPPSIHPLQQRDPKSQPPPLPSYLYISIVAHKRRKKSVIQTHDYSKEEGQGERRVGRRRSRETQNGGNFGAGAGQTSTDWGLYCLRIESSRRELEQYEMIQDWCRMLPRNHLLNAERVQCKVKSQNTERYDNLDETGWNTDMGLKACGWCFYFRLRGRLVFYARSTRTRILQQYRY